jgi:hypothetical protein
VKSFSPRPFSFEARHCPSSPRWCGRRAGCATTVAPEPHSVRDDRVGQSPLEFTPVKKAGGAHRLEDNVGLRVACQPVVDPPAKVRWCATMRLDDVMKALTQGAALAVVSMGCGGALRLEPYPPERNRCEEQAVYIPFALPDAGVSTVTACTTTDCFPPKNERCLRGREAVPGALTVEGPFAQPDGGTNECCYIVMRQSPATAFGRPLLDANDDARTAALVTRADWS